MDKQQSANPLHGVTLQKMLEDLIEFYGFDTLGELIKIKCFTDQPSLKSCLAFLRKTPWARTKVEQLYLRTISKLKRNL
ncbi:MAG TPA: VF530 family protein [Flavobacterium sp.]|nr:VF530 family protein [Flavobacterium sp.]